MSQICAEGTAATAVAGIYGALRVMGKGVASIKDQRVVCVGAGSAGMGVTRVIALGKATIFNNAFVLASLSRITGWTHHPVSTQAIVRQRSISGRPQRLAEVP